MMYRPHSIVTLEGESLTRHRLECKIKRKKSKDDHTYHKGCNRRMDHHTKTTMSTSSDKGTKNYMDDDNEYVGTTRSMLDTYQKPWKVKRRKMCVFMLVTTALLLCKWVGVGVIIVGHARKGAVMD